jgi:hypothetical protein
MFQTRIETQDFVHPQLGREVTAIGGHYVFGKEIRLPYNILNLLYFIGYTVLDSTCCGIGGCAYALVPGFIRQWKYKKNPDECFISKMDPIRDLAMQKDVRKLI